MVCYEMCLVPLSEDKKYHNFKLFIGDTATLYLSDGRRQKGKITCFKQDGIVLDNMCFCPLSLIYDVGFISRGDKGTDYK